MRSLAVAIFAVLPMPAGAQSLPDPNATFGAFEERCRTNVGIRDECVSSVTDAAKAAFETEHVVCQFLGLWAAAELMDDPPAADRKWPEVVDLAVSDLGVCTAG